MGKKAGRRSGCIEGEDLAREPELVETAFRILCKPYRLVKSRHKNNLPV